MQQSMYLPRIMTLVVAASVLAGCSNEPPYGDVFGKVTLDGKPISEGAIRFVPIDGKTSSAGALIKDGEYRQKVRINKVRVEISSPNLAVRAQRSPTSKPGELVESDVEATPTDLIPARYNVNSDLELDLNPGDNPQDFDLKSR
jgi:hypothetical protein